MARTGSSYYFTEDIILEILSWLSIISLLRSRAVCKLWRSIISNPRFVEAHMANFQNKPTSILSVLRILRNDEEIIDGFDDITFIHTRNDFVRLDLPSQFVGMNYYIRSCNSLVCLSNTHGDVIHLWNPSTRMFKKLPTPNIQARCFNLDLGFCYDSVSKDYKLLRILLSKFSNDIFVTHTVLAELYSANDDSWKQILVPEKVKLFRPYPHSKCVLSKNGVLYMEGFYELMSFDLHNEAIAVYPFHTFIKYRRSNVLNFNGYVAMISGSDSDASALSIWTLDDGRGKMSWSKNFNLESHLKIDWINIYLDNGLFVTENNEVGHILYDSRKKETKKFPNTTNISDVISVVKYTESLGSLEGFEQLV